MRALFMDRRAGGDVDRMNVGQCGDVEERARLSRARKAARGVGFIQLILQMTRAAARVDTRDSIRGRQNTFVGKRERAWMEDEFRRIGNGRLKINRGKGAEYPRREQTQSEPPF